MPNSIKFNLPAAEYFEVEAVSNTSLKWWMRSAEHYHAYRTGRIPNTPTQSQTTGTLTHAMVLEGKSDYVVHPAEYTVALMMCPQCESMTTSAKCAKCKRDRVEVKTAKPWNRSAKVCEEWEAAQPTTVISQSEADTIAAGRAAVNLHPVAGPLFCRGRSEVSLFATCPRTQLPLKARLDYLVSPENGQGYIVDLKTCQDASTNGFYKAVSKYRYQRQAAFYKYVAELCGLDVTTFYFVALELEPIPMANVVIVSEQDAEIATQGIHQNLKDIADCGAAGIWPGYCGTGPNILKPLPIWAHDLNEEELTGATEITE